MKYLLFIFILINPSKSFGTDTIPTENVIWSELRKFTGVAPGLGVSEKHSYKINRDTIINDIEYKLLEYNYDLFVLVSTTEGNTSVFKDSVFHKIGGIRQENNMVFFYLFDNGGGPQPKEFIYMIEEEENLIYDFNVELGDTLFWKKSGFNDYSVVLSIDSTETEDGITRRRINFGNEGFYRDSWIEGVGSNAGLFGSYNSHDEMGYIPYLFCCNVDDTNIFDNTYFFSGCNTNFEQFLPIQEDEVEQEEYDGPILIYPNPVEENLVIKVPTGTEFNIRIYSLFGSILYDQKGLNNQPINTTNLQRGIYLVMLTDSDGTILHKTKIRKN